MGIAEARVGDQHMILGPHPIGKTCGAQFGQALTRTGLSLAGVGNSAAGLNRRAGRRADDRWDNLPRAHVARSIPRAVPLRQLPGPHHQFLERAVAGEHRGRQAERFLVERQRHVVRADRFVLRTRRSCLRQ